MISYDNPQLILPNAQELEPGAIRWSSPSNLAIVKYWGKHGRQLPRNPSVSLTLDAASTDTTLRYSPRDTPGKGIALDFYFDGAPREDFARKVVAFLESLLPVFPFLEQLSLRIDTNNTFPHSAGIASSASAMSALALGLCSLEDELFGTLGEDEEFHQKASYLARLGSGSACRSIYAHAAIWGETPDASGSSDLYGTPFGHEMHPVFHTFHDDILFISKAEKSVSSRAGHGLMEGNIYADSRYEQARRRLRHLLDAMRRGDVEAFGAIAEAEALTLHALMMTSTPPYLLLEPNTLSAIRAVQAFRQETGHPLYFSLDAGPNLHLLYPAEVAYAVQPFVQEVLLPFCTDGQYLPDAVGEGPVQLEVEEIEED